MTNTKRDAERQQELIRRWQDHDEFLTGSEMAELLNALVDERQARASQQPRPVSGELFGSRLLRANEWLDKHVTRDGNYFYVLDGQQGTSLAGLLAAFAASERGQWVSKNGFTLCREDGPKMYIGVVDFMLGWTPKPEDALYLSRREDADKLAEICEDAWTVESLPLPAPPAEKGEGR